ncbi:MAG: DUF4830 domain-containing protein [Firmicutes bacterium]|nr:DUF4830 domain-containing protein [Bacillota bacterium]
MKRVLKMLIALCLLVVMVIPFAACNDDGGEGGGDIVLPDGAPGFIADMPTDPDVVLDLATEEGFIDEGTTEIGGIRLQLFVRYEIKVDGQWVVVSEDSNENFEPTEDDMFRWSVMLVWFIEDGVDRSADVSEDFVDYWYEWTWCDETEEEIEVQIRDEWTWVFNFYQEIQYEVGVDLSINPPTIDLDDVENDLLYVGVTIGMDYLEYVIVDNDRTGVILFVITGTFRQMWMI